MIKWLLLSCVAGLAAIALAPVMKRVGSYILERFNTLDEAINEEEKPDDEKKEE